MSTQADVRSIESLKIFRIALGIFSEEALASLGTVDAEVRRTVQWLQHDRREFWQLQIKKRREAVASARAEVFRRKIAKTADGSPAMSEQKEILRKAEASLHDAELRVILVKKWEPKLQQAALEYRASTRRISNLAAADVERAMMLLNRLVDALEGYLNIAIPSLTPSERMVQVIQDFETETPANSPAEDEPESSPEPPDPD